MAETDNDTSGREQSTSVLLDAPVELVWEVWTKPEHIKHWWGPDGFTNTIDVMQVEPGGQWIFTMLGPDGTNYPNKTIFREVVKHKKLVHEHFNPNFVAIVQFERDGNSTLLNWHKLYESKELFEIVEKQHKAEDGFKQTVQRLENYLLQKMSK